MVRVRNHSLSFPLVLGILFLSLAQPDLSSASVPCPADPSHHSSKARLERFAAEMEAAILENRHHDGENGRYVIVDGAWLEQEGDGPAPRALIATLNAKLNGFNADSPTKFYIGLRGIAAVPALQAAPTDGTPSSLDDQLGYLKEGMDREAVETALGYARQLETEHIGGIMNRPHVRAGPDILIFTYSRYLVERISAEGTVGEVYGLAAHYATPGIAAQGARLRGHYRANREFYDFVDNAERALPEYIEKGIAVLGSPPFDSDPVYAGPCTPEMEAVLLASFADHPWLERDSPLRDMILRSPCILRGTRSTGEGLGYETQWSRDMHRVFGAALWTAFAPLAIEVLGPSLFEQYGARKAREFALGMAIDAGLQVAIATTFGGKDFGEAVSDIDRYQALASGAESLADNVYLSAGVSCLLDGLTEKGRLDGNLSVGRFGRECATGALSAVLADRLLKGGGRLFTKLRAIARADPLGFGSGLAGLNITGTEEVRRVCGYLELDGATTDRVLSACFVAGTPVLMADGSRKPIQTVMVGDLVATFDEPIGATSEGRVVNTFHRTVGRLITVRAGGDLIRATPEHPFHVDGQWVTAQHLKKGDRFTGNNGTAPTVTEVGAVDTLSVVHNIEVAAHHNYFVGERGILVHNRCLPLPKELLEVHGWLSVEIREKLEGWGSDRVEALLRDLKEAPDLLEALGERPFLVGAWKKLDDLGETTLKTDVDWLKRVDDWDAAGVQLSKNGDNLKLSDGSGNALGEFKNGDLLPEKYDFPVNASSTPVGDVNNGYQVFKDGSGNLSVRRVPDKSPYNSSELTELTQHPNAHVLERHGHDVTDDALIKRAQTPSVTPDGKVANNPPPHSSKFNSADNLKEGLNNTRPGTTAFNNGVQQGNTRIVTYTSTKVLGKGVSRNGSSFVNMQKVKAIYRDVGGGNYQLITMYPEL